jgi:hypothetical protein
MWTVSSPSLDVYAVAEGMEARGWDVSRTREPEGIHLIVDPFEDDGLIADYVADLEAATAEVREARRTRATAAASTY